MKDPLDLLWLFDKVRAKQLLDNILFEGSQLFCYTQPPHTRHHSA